MAYTNLNSILGYVTLTKAVQEIKSGIPNPFPEQFFSVTDRTLKDRARYTVYKGQRALPKLNRYGSPARRAELKEVGERDVKLLHTFEDVMLDPLTFKYLRGPESYEHDKALMEVKRQIKEFKKKFENLRVAAVAQVLSKGAIYWDSEGNFLPTSSGADETHDFQVPANNKNQLNSIIGASWATASTDIPGHLKALKQQAVKDHGYEPVVALYGRNIPEYFAKNTLVQAYLARNPQMNDAYLSSAHGEIPDGLFGFKWIPVYTSFFEDSSGTNQNLWDNDLVTFMPDLSTIDEWYGMFEGSYEVPRTIDISTFGDQAMNNLETVYGMFGYSMVTHNPVGVTQYYGDTCVPVLKVPNVIYQADVAF